jgi:cytochrome c biogenesis protein CcdA
MSAAADGGRSGPWMLAAGLALSFALAGTLLSFILMSTGLDPEAFRWLAGSVLILVALALLVRPLGAWLNARLSSFSGRFAGSAPAALTSKAQFGVGALLGVVWLPCVGPTLGAAIGLASMGQNLVLAFATMAAYGASTAAVLLAAGLVSRRALTRWRPTLLVTAERGKKLLGLSLLVLGLLVVSGLDKRFEALVVPLLPEWTSVL